MSSVIERKTEKDWAKRNLELAGWLKEDGLYGSMVGEAVLKLIDTHFEEGHSGMSHQICINLFYKIMKGEALTQEMWDEKFEYYNNHPDSPEKNTWSQESFEEIVMKKPKK